MGKWSFDSTIGDLLDNEKTRTLIQELAPEVFEHPMIEIGKAFTVNQAMPFIEGLASEDRIENFRQHLEALED
ncbi:MAG: hypothetical protein LBS36_03805 [Oscillospiraceae bacterium]|jgi:hypothetical protein|nr:hypothetical protein [Oscillospiraceae bacterium]